MALAVKVFETSTAKELAVMVDSRRDEPAIFGSFLDYTRYGQHRKTANMWAERLATLLDAPPGTGVKPPIWFTINPF